MGLSSKGQSYTIQNVNGRLQYFWNGYPSGAYWLSSSDKNKYSKAITAYTYAIENNIRVEADDYFDRGDCYLNLQQYK